MSSLSVSDEKHPIVVSGEFRDEDAARLAMRRVAEEASLPRAQIDLVVPGDENAGAKVEPESRRIGGTLLRSHVVLGGGALIVGLLAAAVLTTVGPTLTRSSPVLTFVALGLLFPFIGMLIAGAISLRPDHDPQIAGARHAAAAGNWTVVVHCSDAAEKEQVEQIIREAGGGESHSL